MSDLITFVQGLRRPSLLLGAARHGLADYNRDRVLKRLTRSASVPSPKGAVSSLLGVEATLESARRSGDASYNVSRHVEVMIALLAEARLLAQPKLRAL
ncbi:MAG: DUF6477 family protein [Rhodobacter sp.]|nr:DUF6477 family protein [Rhodobacter sp.]